MKSIVYASSLSEALRNNISSEGGIFSGSGSLGDVTSSILQIALPLAGTAAVVLLTIAGYKMITSQGNPEKLKDAKEMITNAVIGLVFILLSVAILGLVSAVFDLEIT